MTKRTRLLISMSVRVLIISGIFFAGKPLSSAQDEAPLSKQDAPFKTYTLGVYCRSPQFPTAGFFHEVPEKAFGNKELCVGKCGGGVTKSFADALAPYPPGVAKAFRDKIAEHERKAAAGDGSSIASCLGNDKPPKKCDTKAACEALERAFRALTEAKTDVRAAPTGYKSLKESLGPLLDMISSSLCDNIGAQNRIDTARKVLSELTFAPGPADDANRSRLSEIELLLTELRTFNCRADQPPYGAPPACEAPREGGPLFKSLVTGYTFFPFTESPQDLIPAQACQGCLWELVLADLTSHQVTEGRWPVTDEQHETCTYRYLSMWRCPATGVVISKRNYKKLDSPCASPQG